MNRARAFTLIELLIVITIIGILAGMILAFTGSMIAQSKWLVTNQRIDGAIEAIQRRRAESTGGYEQFLDEAIGLDVRFHPLVKILSNLQDTTQFGPTTGTVFAGGSATTRPAHLDGRNQLPPWLYVVWGGANTVDVAKRFAAFAWLSDLPGVNDQGTSYPAREMITSVAEIAPTRQVMALKRRPSAYWYATAWPVAWPATTWDQATPPTVTPHVGSGCLFPSPAPASVGTGVSQYQPVPPGLLIRGSPFAKNRIRAYPQFIGGVEHDMNFTKNQTSLSTLQIAKTPGSVEPPEPADLSQFSPLLTARWLRYAGILGESTGLADFRSDRNSSRAWNDRWGNPLVLATCLFIPNRYLGQAIDSTSTDPYDPFFGATGNPPLMGVGAGGHLGNARYWFGTAILRNRDFLLNAYRESLGYDRSVFLSGGAVGPVRAWSKLKVDGSPEPTDLALPGFNGSGPMVWTAETVGTDADLGVSSTLAPNVPVCLTDRKILRGLWTQVTVATQASRWDQNAGSTPPWKGSSLRQSATIGTVRVECLVTNPIEVK
ncbi:hypothetical protein LBMAG53_22360 [Planctomycetota bacterium]|nr:hypothetical protein LBMAG53_22360 [Planctomycetota bacterium]